MGPKLGNLGSPNPSRVARLEAVRAVSLGGGKPVFHRDTFAPPSWKKKEEPGPAPPPVLGPERVLYCACSGNDILELSVYLLIVLKRRGLES